MSSPDAVRVGSRWAIEFEGHTFLWSAMTLLHASKALEVSGGSWADLHPLESPDHLCGILAAFLFGAGEDFDAAVARIAALNVEDALGLVRAV